MYDVEFALVECMEFEEEEDFQLRRLRKAWTKGRGLLEQGLKTEMTSFANDLHTSNAIGDGPGVIIDASTLALGTSTGVDSNFGGVAENDTIGLGDGSVTGIDAGFGSSTGTGPLLVYELEQEQV